MSKEVKKFLENEYLVNREFYEYYRNNRNSTAKEIDQYNYFVKAVSGLLRLIKKELAERESGVYIRDFGYFCCVRARTSRKNPIEKSPLKKGKKIFKYYYWFIPVEKYKDWYLQTDSNINRDKRYKIDLETIHLYLEVSDYNKRLSRENKNIKFITCD